MIAMRCIRPSGMEKGMGSISIDLSGILVLIIVVLGIGAIIGAVWLIRRQRPQDSQ